MTPFHSTKSEQNYRKVKKLINETFDFEKYDYSNLSLIDILYNIERRYDLIESYSTQHDLLLKKEHIKTQSKSPSISNSQKNKIKEFDDDLINILIPTTALINDEKKAKKRFNNIIKLMSNDENNSEFNEKKIITILKSPTKNAPPDYVQKKSYDHDTKALITGRKKMTIDDGGYTVNAISYSDIYNCQQAFKEHCIDSSTIKDDEKKLIDNWIKSEKQLISNRQLDEKFEESCKRIIELQDKGVRDLFNTPFYELIQLEEILIKVDIRKSKERLINDFRNMINHIKDVLDSTTTHNFPIDYLSTLINSLKNDKLFEFFDLKFWLATQCEKFTYDDFGLLLYGDRELSEPGNKAKQTTLKNASETFTTEFIEALSIKFKQITY